MVIDRNDIKALHIDMARVLDDADYVARHFLKGQRKAANLVEQDIRHLRDHLRRLAKHLAQLQQLHSNNVRSDNNRFDDELDPTYGIELPMHAEHDDVGRDAPKQ